MATNVKDVTIRINVDDSDVKKTEKDFDSLNKTVNKGAKETTKSLGGMSKSLVGIGAALGGLVALKAIVGDATKRILAFEKSISSLSAITGATGKDLEKLKGLVLEVSKNTKRSAIEIAGAFELIGSKAPQLLENADALAAVTEEAIILSKASGGDLVESAGALTGVMNQFNLTATDSSRIINALAAGSQKGAAPVGDIAAAIDKFGTVAAAANVSVENSIGLVETLAEKNINGAEAGTQLRNIILKLQSANIGFTDGVFNLNDALEEVKNKNLSAAESAKLFGLESVTAGNILVNGTETIDKYTEAVTGTSTAYDQAIIQTDNLSTKIEELDATYESLLFAIEDGDGVVSNIAKGAVDGVTSLLEGLTELINFDFDRPEEAFNSYLKALTGVDFALDETGRRIEALDNELGKVSKSQLDNKEVALKVVKAYVGLGLSAEDAFQKYKDLRGETVKGTVALEEETIATDNNTKSKEKQLSIVEKIIAQSKEQRLLRDEEIDEDTGLDADFLKAEGLDDDSLAKRKEALEEKKVQDEDAAIARFDSDLEFNELTLEQEQQFADAKALIDEQIKNSAIGLAGALIGLAGDSQAAQLAALVFDKGIAIARVATGAAAANALIVSEAAALSIPTAGASVVAGAALVTANNTNAALQIATIIATALPQAVSIAQPKKLKDGEVRISGAGSTTSDSIPAMLSREESVINAKSSIKHEAALRAINNDNFEEYMNRAVMQRLYMGNGKQKSINVSSTNKSVKFPERMSIKNARAISKPIVDAIEDSNFLKGAGWD